jgi:hypothetical protein
MEFELNLAIEVLERTPSTFRALLGGLGEAWTAPNEGKDTFSAFDNLGHLVHGERVNWVQRAQVVLEQGERGVFAQFDRFAFRRDSEGKRVGDLLDEFARLRTANLDTLRGWNLTDRELAMAAMHPVLGPVSLRQLLSAWVVHDLGHIAQTSRVMAKQYRDAVGPFREFLPILDR